ncbi:unnamed protein product [Rhizophagus irregularis]|nr:unnamed protein product [Rhizophagus irregularis]
MSSSNPKRTNESRNSSGNSNKRVRQQEDRLQGPVTNVEASRIVIDRMTVQRILSKLSTIESKISETDLKLSDIKGQVQKIEDRLKSEPNDENVIAEAVKNIAKNLIKIAIYPIQAQFLQQTEAYLSENKPDFYKRVSRKHWTSYYERNILHDLLNKLRSFRSTFATRIKEAMFAAFGSDQLPPINTNDSPADIAEWKASSKVRKCYKKLLIPHNSYMKRIFEKVFSSNRDKRYKVQVAFTLALVEHMLDPKRKDIKIKEDLMQIKIEKYMNRVDNGLYDISNEEYSDDDEDDTSDTEMNKGQNVNDDKCNTEDDEYTKDVDDTQNMDGDEYVEIDELEKGTD